MIEAPRNTTKKVRRFVRKIAQRSSFKTTLGTARVFLPCDQLIVAPAWEQNNVRVLAVPSMGGHGNFDRLVGLVLNINCGVVASHFFISWVFGGSVKFVYHTLA